MDGHYEGQTTKGSVQYINPDGMLKNPAFTQVVVASGPVRTLYVGLQHAVDAARRIIGEGDIAAQTERVLKNVQMCLEAGGAGPEHIVIWTIYHVEGQPVQPAFEVFQRWWGNRPNPPANNVLTVSSLGIPGILIGIEAIAVVPLRSEV